MSQYPRNNAKSPAKSRVVSQRILACRQRMGLSQTEFGQKVGASLRAVQLWESAVSLPQPARLRRLSEVTGLPIPWFLGEAAPESFEADVLREGPAETEGLEGDGRLVRAAQLFSRGVPVVSWARAGEGGNFDDLANQINERLSSDCADPNAYALIIEGDSMMPEVKPGDRVIFMPNTAPQNGDIVVARLDCTGDVLCKLFHQTGPQGEIIRLTSFNPAYPPLEYPRQDFRFIHPMHSLVRRQSWRR